MVGVGAVKRGQNLTRWTHQLPWPRPTRNTGGGGWKNGRCSKILRREVYFEGAARAKLQSDAYLGRRVVKISRLPRERGEGKQVTMARRKGEQMELDVSLLLPSLGERHDSILIAMRNSPEIAEYNFSSSSLGCLDYRGEHLHPWVRWLRLYSWVNGGEGVAGIWHRVSTGLFCEFS